MSCSKSSLQKYATRPSPPRPANESGCRGQTKVGNDGKKWVSVSNVRGVYRWVALTKKSVKSKSPAKRSVKSKSPAKKKSSTKLQMNMFKPTPNNDWMKTFKPTPGHWGLEPMSPYESTGDEYRRKEGEKDAAKLARQKEDRREDLFRHAIERSEKLGEPWPYLLGPPPKGLKQKYIKDEPLFPKDPYVAPHQKDGRVSVHGPPPKKYDSKEQIVLPAFGVTQWDTDNVQKFLGM